MSKNTISIDDMSKDQLRKACKDAAIKYGSMSNLQMREALKQHTRPAAPAVAVVNAQPTIIAPVEAAPAAEPVVTTQPEVAPEPAKPGRLPKDHRNGVTKPTRGLTLDVWNACDALKAEGKDTTFEHLKEKLPDHNAATIRTQRQRWKQFNA